MATTKAKHVKRMKVKSLKKRLKSMVDKRKEFKKVLENIHVHLQPGNNKTGDLEYTVSLIPGADCAGKCMRIDKVNKDDVVERGDGGCFWTGCYDIQNVCFQENVQIDRARNSAIHKWDRPRYWMEIEEQVVELDVKILRINVGGDVDYVDMCYINAMAKRQPQCKFHFFTKEDDALNLFIERHGDFPSNVKYLLSAWPGMTLCNPHYVPESHLMWEDGFTTLPAKARNIEPCHGNCTNCWLYVIGCPKTKRAECEEEKWYQILFAH